MRKHLILKKVNPTPTVVAFTMELLLVNAATTVLLVTPDPEVRKVNLDVVVSMATVEYKVHQDTSS